jgi:hypothetical protein
MLIDGSQIDGEQLGELLLGEPDGLRVDAHFHLHLALGRRVKSDVLGRGRVSHAVRS